MSDSQEDLEFEALLEYLKINRGFDFTGYKRASLRRRINLRLREVGLEKFPDYLDHLEVHPEEFNALFNTILINVTDFFRDPEAWEYLASEILPRMISQKMPEEPIRVWCAGASTGEESLTIAMLLREALGMIEYRQRVKIYATDVDEDELRKARTATYPPKKVKAIPAGLLERYFQLAGANYIFDQELRRSVIFGRHNLIEDAPISRCDLLICRNLLMYFNSESQKKILSRLHFALREGGFLFLGKAEMLAIQGHLFTPVNLKHRVFTKVGKDRLRDQLMVISSQAGEEARAIQDGRARLFEAAFEAAPVAQLVVDSNGQLVLANHWARVQFGLSADDLGRPFQNLEISYQPKELRATLEQVVSEKIPIFLPDVEWHKSSGQTRFLEIQIVPLLDNGICIGACINFLDVTTATEIRLRLSHTNQELETAMEELQSTNEELETTNEELQSTIEELETTNEELQSTNEELETMNEELQSTNREMETLNVELHQSNRAFDQVNSFFQSILSNLQAGVIVLDVDLQVLIWNERSEDLWGLRRNEVIGQHFLNLDIGLPVEQLKKPIRSCLLGQGNHQEITIEARNRRGRDICIQVKCTPLIDLAREVQGVILLIEELPEEH